MINDSDLKILLQRDISNSDKLLATIASFNKPIGFSEIRAKAKSLGCNMDRWNLSTLISRNKGQTLNVPGGHEVSEKGKIRLAELGSSNLTKAAAEVASSLRLHLNNIQNVEHRKFIEECVLCYENGLYRSSVVMGWLAAIDILHHEVIINHLDRFNAEAQRVDGRWKKAITADDLGRMKESDFLDRLASISVIGKNVKEELQKALILRNAAGHPNSLRVSSNQAAAHLELLILNVFEKFSKL